MTPSTMFLIRFHHDIIDTTLRFMLQIYEKLSENNKIIKQKN